eukprot:7650876-Alexandrium_andersonii.AAC.1
MDHCTDRSYVVPTPPQLLMKKSRCRRNCAGSSASRKRRSVSAVAMPILHLAGCADEAGT